MAKVRNNLIVQGLSGTLGNQIVFRKGKDGQTIVAAKPAFDANRILTPSQQAHHAAFRNAIAYAKAARDEAVYITKAEGTRMSPFNAAVADWFNEPEVLEINANGWNGEQGGVIRIKAQDDTQVQTVEVIIRDQNGATLEQGFAVQGDGLWWTYTATTEVTDHANARIVATAYDIPGNATALTWQN